MYGPLELLFHIEISRGVEICNKPLPASPLGTLCAGCSWMAVNISLQQKLELD